MSQTHVSSCHGRLYLHGSVLNPEIPTLNPEMPDPPGLRWFLSAVGSWHHVRRHVATRCVSAACRGYFTPRFHTWPSSFHELMIRFERTDVNATLSSSSSSSSSSSRVSLVSGGAVQSVNKGRRRPAAAHDSRHPGVWRRCRQQQLVSLCL